MTTTWNARQIEISNQFTERMDKALTEAGLEGDYRYGFVLGWLYGQLRQRLSKEQVREAIEQAIAKCERQLDDVAQT